MSGFILPPQLIVGLSLILCLRGVGGVACGAIGLRVSEVHLDAPVKDIVWLTGKVRRPFALPYNNLHADCPKIRISWAC